MKYEMKLREVYFEKIKSGEKIYEIRLFDEKRKLIKIGDVIVFKKEPNPDEFLVTEVVEMQVFKSFKAMAETLPNNSIGFAGFSADEIEKIYSEFYSKADEQKYGVVAIKVKRI